MLRRRRPEFQRFPGLPCALSGQCSGSEALSTSRRNEDWLWAGSAMVSRVVREGPTRCLLQGLRSSQPTQSTGRDARLRPPIPRVKGVVIALVFAARVAACVLMVPLLENHALSDMLLCCVFFLGLRSGNPLTMVLVISFALIPTAGVTGARVSALSNAFFPDTPVPAAAFRRPPLRVLSRAD